MRNRDVIFLFIYILLLLLLFLGGGGGVNRVRDSPRKSQDFDLLSGNPGVS